MYDAVNGVAIKTTPNLQCWGVRDTHFVPFCPKALLRLLRVGGDLYFIQRGEKKVCSMLDRPDTLPNIVVGETSEHLLFVPYYFDQPIPLGERIAQQEEVLAGIEIVQLSFFEVLSMCAYRQNVIFRQGLHIVTSTHASTNLDMRPPVKYLRTAVNKAGRLVHWVYAEGSVPENYATLWGIRLPLQRL